MGRPRSLSSSRTPRRQKRGQKRGLGSLLHSRCGTTAVEFAIAGPVFLLMMLIVIEDGIMLFSQGVLDNATQVASRQIMIGTVTTSSQFQSVLCANASPLLNCANLQYNVVSGSAFPSSVTQPQKNGSFSSASFSPGQGDDFVLVEVSYYRSFVTAWLSALSGGGWAMLSTRAFRNEPFS